MTEEPLRFELPEPFQDSLQLFRARLARKRIQKLEQRLLDGGRKLSLFGSLLSCSPFRDEESRAPSRYLKPYR